MIIEDIFAEGTRVRHYSDSGMKIRQIETGVIYEDAVDDYPSAYTYEETDIPVESREATAEEILNIILGGAE